MPKLLFALLCIAPALAAQSPAQREQLEALRDSLAGVHDSVSLQALESQLIGHARREARDSAMAHLRLGFIALRLGDLASRSHFDDAGSEFQWAIDLQPNWPYAHFGLGLAELGVGDAQFALVRGLQTALGKDALTRSANAFARSAEVDPSFVRGLVELTNTALRQRINLRMDVALIALRRAASTPAASNPQVELARARIEREVGSPDSALAAVDALVRKQPDDPEAALEQARVDFKLGRLEGGDAWYRGLARATGNALALYRSDLLFVLPDSELHHFDAATPAQRVGEMRHFWDLRDRDQLHQPGERLMEHYRRLDFARHNYRLASTHRHYDIVERYRPPVAEFDDRGVVYIRQGAPDEHASLEQPGIPYNESWAYHHPGQPDLLFHFVAREGVTDFRLVESALDILGYANAVRLENTGDIQGNDLVHQQHFLNRLPNVSSDSAAKLRQLYSDMAVSGAAAALLRSRQQLNPIYGRMLGSGKGSASGFEAEERTLGARSIRVGTSTDEWVRHYAVALPAQVQVLAVGGDSLQSTLQIAYAIPDRTLVENGRLAAPHLRASVIGLDGAVTAVVDTVLAATALQHTDAGDQRLGLLSVAVPAGRYGVRVGLELGRAGVVSERDTVRVTAPEGPKLGLSDLTLGHRSVDLAWRAQGHDTVRVDPVAEFSATEPMQLYFEVTGARTVPDYKIDIEVRHPGNESVFKRLGGIFGGGGAALRVSFTQRPVLARDPVRRDIALQKLNPGRYVLEVTATAPGGEKMSRQQEFVVVH